MFLMLLVWILITFIGVTLVLPSPVTNLTVTAKESNKLMLSWIPGHDGFSSITSCHVRVSPTRGENAATVFDCSPDLCSIQGQRDESEERGGDHNQAR